MPIIRVTKAQIAKANKAREAALLENPEYRLYEERLELLRQAASQKKGQIEDANKAPQSSAPNEPESVARETERDS